MRPLLGILSAALLTSALSAVPEPASAATTYWYWRDDPGPMMPRPAQRKRPRAPRHAAEPAAAKSQPEGPLIIAISIQHQQLKLYDVNGLYAEAPVSTGMPGHSTPMGVFSVLEKQRWHRSNIYSGAPMPYMQRITWSGVAIHEGVLPGYPASHGCIRMPGAFAVKLWAWTKRGARVIIVPGEISPSDFSHPKLIAHMVDAPPSASAAPATNVRATTDKAAAPAAANAEAPAPDKAADVKSDLKLTTLADASSETLALPKHAAEQPAQDANKTQDRAEQNSAAAATTRVDAAATVAKAPEAEAPSHESGSTMDAADQQAVAHERDSATDNSVERTIDTFAVAVEPAPVVIEGGPRAIDANPRAQRDVAAEASEPKPAEISGTVAAAPSVAAIKDSSKPDDATASAPVVRKAEAASPAAAPAAAASPPPADPRDIPTVIGPKRTGHVAVYISRRDRRLYVRQNFLPVFDVPVEITDQDRPFGTFVFTARGDKNDATALHWSVVAMPIANRKTVGQALGRNGKRTKPIVETVLTPSSTEAAAEALDRITVPEWALERVAEAIKPGGSIVISDHGLGDETGEGTDFIVPLR